MKDQILKIAGVKSEKEFYKKYPTEEAFMKTHGKAFKKAEMGTSMVKKQLEQLTDFGNPAQAQYGTSFKPLSFDDAMTTTEAINAGVTKEQYVANKNLNRVQGEEEPTIGGDGLSNLLSMGMDVAGQFMGDGEEEEMEDGGYVMVPKAQWGAIAGAVKNIGQGSGGIGNLLTDAIGGKGKSAGIMKAGKDVFSGGFKSGIKNLGTKSGLGAAGKAAGLGVLNAAPEILQGIGQMKEQKNQIAKAQTAADVSSLVNKATGQKPVEIQKQNIKRIEDDLVQNDQLAPAQGVGTNFLQAQDGAAIGGNPTEIQNMYTPGTLYSDLGYEPLGESLKQYRHGGGIPQAGLGFNDLFQSSGQASIGKGVGSALGSVFGGPLGGMIGGALGSVAGNLFGGARDAKKLAGLQEQRKKNMLETAGAQMSSGIRSQFKAYTKDGGWVSHDWQPQVITQFGEHKLKDLLKPPYDADMLRAGGSIGSGYYTPPSAEALETYQYGGNMAMGGDLKVHWGGDAEVLSNNDYVGEIVQFRGKDHEESAGGGRTGVGITYGGKPVEVEGGGDGNHHNGEIGVKMKDGGSEENLTIYGNVKITKEIADMLGDKTAVNKKFKRQAKDIALNDAKQTKIMNKAGELANSADDNSIYDQLTLNSAMAMNEGGKMQKKINAQKLQDLALVQDSLLAVSEKYGVDPNEVLTAKFGKTISKAQKGENVSAEEFGFKDPITHEFITDMGYNTLPDVVVKSSKKGYTKGNHIPTERNVSMGDSLGNYLRGLNADPKISEKKKGKVDWKLLGNALLAGIPFGQFSNQRPMDPSQIMPEQLALLNNELEPVQAQQFAPLLQGAPGDISLQDQLNEITAQSRVAERMMQNNPEAAAALFADVANAKTKVLGQEFRMNQARKEEVYDRNRQLLNDARLQNLGILDKQYERQSVARSKTKAQALEAVKSMVAKEIQHNALNRKLGIMENAYGFRFTPQGQAFSINNPAQFNMYGSGKSTTGGLAEGLEYTYDANQNIIGTRKKPSKSTSSVANALSMLEDDEDSLKKGGKVKKKNSSIVKAFKNL